MLCIPDWILVPRGMNAREKEEHDARAPYRRREPLEGSQSNIVRVKRTWTVFRCFFWEWIVDFIISLPNCIVDSCTGHNKKSINQSFTRLLSHITGTGLSTHLHFTTTPIYIFISNNTLLHKLVPYHVIRYMLQMP